MKKIKGRSPTSAHAKRASKQKAPQAVQTMWVAVFSCGCERTTYNTAERPAKKCPDCDKGGVLQRVIKTTEYR